MSSQKIFINKAPDKKYLMVKVATNFGLFEACRRKELCSLLVEDVEVTKKSKFPYCW